MTRRAVGWGRGYIGIALALVILSAGCAGYGGQTADSPDGLKVKSEAEHCQITLPQGWTWRPAAWSAVSPDGTELAFMEHLFGRPQHPSWEESKAEATAQATARGATATDEGDTLILDFGPTEGLSILHRFDRAGCQLTFSPKPGVRPAEQAVWQQIIDSLERITPTG